MPRFDADWIDFMLRPERRESPPAEDTLALFELRPGLDVVDVGCGPGFFTIPLARAVGPAGRVYAVDLRQDMLDLVAARAAEVGSANVTLLRSTGPGIPVEDAVADLTLCALVLHDLSDPVPLVAELQRITRPTGKIAVIEWTPEVDDPRRNRIPPERAAALFRQAGRAVQEIRNLSDRQYLLIAR
jgi:ubiquinone/menaquinone biosynthesis C-methylase UbiE